MNDWTSGYMAEIGYIHGYYRELNPAAVRFALLSSGYNPPDIANACELGFGQGLSINVHAAAATARWYGNDFNPSQAQFALEMAAASGASVSLHDQSFAEFGGRSDLPDLDFIGLHGVWSWVSPENQATIIDFIRRKLKVGGVLYISYNTQPGWAPAVPLRYLLAEHVAAHSGPISSRIDGALEFVQSMFEQNPAYSKANPDVAERINTMQGQSKSYLAHEFFNRDWAPIHFSQMASLLGQSKLTYACSAALSDHVDAVNLTDTQRVFLTEIGDVNFRQTVRDFMVNQQFRRDYWVKGARRLSPLEQAELLAEERVVLITPAAPVPRKLTGALGEVTLNSQIYDPIVEALADHKAKSIRQLYQDLASRGISWSQLTEAVLMLMGTGAIAAALPLPVVERGRDQCRRLNKFIVSQSRSSNDFSRLASPICGTGIEVSRFEQMFLSAYLRGEKDPVEWSKSAWALLKSQNQKIVAPEGILETDDANLQNLLNEARTFAQSKLPILTSLEMI